MIAIAQILALYLIAVILSAETIKQALTPISLLASGGFLVWMCSLNTKPGYTPKPKINPDIPVPKYQYPAGNYKRRWIEQNSRKMTKHQYKIKMRNSRNSRNSHPNITQKITPHPLHQTHP